MSMSDTCGLFGKLPMQSDFISHFLPATFTDYWHGWLQACLSVSQEQLGDDWRDYYLTSPIWRFAIMPGVILEQGILGAMMPCVDEVGRYFPLTLAHLDNHQPWTAYLNGRAWFEHIEQILLLALQDDLGYADYIAHFEKAAPPDIDPWPQRVTYFDGHGNNRNTVVEAVDLIAPTEGVLQLLDDNYQRLLGPYSLWWTEGSDHIAPCLLTCSHLPDSGQYAAMLDGKWQQWNWSVSAVAETRT